MRHHADLLRKVLKRLQTDLRLHLCMWVVVGVVEIGVNDKGSPFYITVKIVVVVETDLVEPCVNLPTEEVRTVLQYREFPTPKLSAQLSR